MKIFGAVVTGSPLEPFSVGCHLGPVYAAGRYASTRTQFDAIFFRNQNVSDKAVATQIVSRTTEPMSAIDAVDGSSNGI